MGQPMTQQTILIDRYQIERELGQGGMGVVYLASDLQTGAQVAVKHLKSEIATPALIERFQREGEALRDLNHPNIVKLLNTFENNGEYYLVMEFVSGGDLSDLTQTAKSDPQQILRYALDLADALTRAHKLNIIHRDLKPANILIAEDGTLRLTDFGIAQLGSKDRITETDAIIGTIDYLPPEAFNGEDIDQRSDIWAFGVILFELIAGERPFTGESITETMQKILIAPLPDLESYNSSVPIDLIDLVYRMLERDPNLRIPSVRHIGAELEDIIHGRSARQPITKRFDTTASPFLITIRHNLPNQTTPFVGRDIDISAVVELLSDDVNRLVTILGPGGMGKTRLSLAIAEQMLGRFTSGVFFVELAPLSDTDAIVSTIAEQIGFSLQADGRSAIEQLGSYFSNGETMLILDNYEHLIDGAHLTTDLLTQSSQLSILVTSRQRLNQTAETVYDLSGMRFSDWESPESALRAEAVQLFVQSARRIQSGFDITSDNLDAIRRICEMMQGMPLGILLSASWLGMLTPIEIADELNQGLELLETDATDLPERQRSIVAVFDYSWERMTQQEQDVFMRLSIFRGGFTREAAQATTDATLRVLMSLMNKSLIRRNTDSGRYEIHELLRQYGYQQLVDAQLETEAHQQFVAYYTELAERGGKELRYANQEHWYRLFTAEHDNIRNAMTWAIQHDPVSATKLITSARDFWFYQGHHIEAYTWMTTLLENNDVLDTSLHAQLTYGLAIISWGLQKIEQAEQLARKAITMLHDSDDLRVKGWAYCILASVMGTLSDHYDETLEVADQALNYFEQIHNLAGLALTYNIIGNAHENMRHFDLAIEAFEKTLEISQQTGEVRRIAMSQANLARFHIENGDYHVGLELSKTSLKLDYQIGFTYMLPADFHGIAMLLSRVDRSVDAVVLLGVMANIQDKLNIHVQPTEQSYLESTLESVRQQLDKNSYEQAWQKGLNMDIDEAIVYALKLEID